MYDDIYAFFMRQQQHQQKKLEDCTMPLEVDSIYRHNMCVCVCVCE